MIRKHALRLFAVKSGAHWLFVFTTSPLRETSAEGRVRGSGRWCSARGVEKRTRGSRELENSGTRESGTRGSRNSGVRRIKELELGGQTSNSGVRREWHVSLGFRMFQSLLPWIGRVNEAGRLTHREHTRSFNPCCRGLVASTPRCPCYARTLRRFNPCCRGLVASTCGGSC